MAVRRSFQFTEPGVFEPVSLRKAKGNRKLPFAVLISALVILQGEERRYTEMMIITPFKLVMEQGTR